MADRFEPTEFWSWGLKPLGRDLRLETGPIVLRSRYQTLDLYLVYEIIYDQKLFEETHKEETYPTGFQCDDCGIKTGLK